LRLPDGAEVGELGLVALMLLLEAISQALLATSFAYKPTSSALGALA